MIKCIYRPLPEPPISPHCDREADYIYLGKSYCKEHMEERASEQNIHESVKVSK